MQMLESAALKLSAGAERSFCLTRRIMFFCVINDLDFCEVMLHSRQIAEGSLLCCVRLCVCMCVSLPSDFRR